MRASIVHTMSRSIPAALIGASLAVAIPASARANSSPIGTRRRSLSLRQCPALAAPAPYMAQRMMGMVDAAMFDAVNLIERRYRPYLAQLPADPATSKEAAAAAAGRHDPGEN